ncbi:MAG: response regulator [Saprospiraceae bacterium]
MNNTSTIFLIDDDADDQEIFSLAIEKASKQARCVFANDGIEALEKLKMDRNFRPDFIFIDMNMPRMNGQQCLAEIKKLDRLKDVAVFMYSTSADPASILENKRLGASDFIQKPSSITELTRILTDIIQQPLVAVLLFLILFSGVPQKLNGQAELTHVKELKKLSVEELMNIVVTSVSKTPENLSEVASAIQVITGYDIRRSSSGRLPEALRLLPNLQVSQSGSHDWGISARGFNGAPVASSSLADKLLVMIDGRTVYTPLFGGVYWDVQNTMLEDIDRIEVVSGPGGTLWGSNAVNGVVNVITKSAKETQGLYISGAAGNYLKDNISLRYGSQIDSSLFFRVFGQQFNYGETELSDGHGAGDQWELTQGGFRLDYLPRTKNSFMLEGEVYGGIEDDTLKTFVNGQNLIGRWTHTFSEKSNLSIQSYFDRTWRDIRNSPFTDELLTFDIELQHEFQLGNKQHMLYGVTYRNQDDQTSSFDNRITPADKMLQLWSGFLQDKIELVNDRIALTIGSKVLHNDYTGVEFQPSARLAWTPSLTHTLWGALSRAVRIPSRFDVDLTSFSLAKHPEFTSEKVVACELGYRIRPAEKLNFSVAGFFNQYLDLRSINTTGDPVGPFYFGNDLKAKTFGIEISGNALISNWWRLRGGWTYLHKDFYVNAVNVFEGTEQLEGIDPENQIILQSVMDICKNLDIDLVGRFVDKLSESTLTSTPSVPSYFTFNARIAYEYKNFTVSLNGRSLAAPTHIEFGTQKIQRSVFGKITLRL